eukprot:m.684695 g.684695  ORF g.684695 m.684695 type:complete len:115 (+) comp58610_c2_seq3:233-577(+)
MLAVPGCPFLCPHDTLHDTRPACPKSRTEQDVLLRCAGLGRVTQCVGVVELLSAALSVCPRHASVLPCPVRARRCPTTHVPLVHMLNLSIPACSALLALCAPPVRLDDGVRPQW